MNLRPSLIAVLISSLVWGGATFAQTHNIVIDSSLSKTQISNNDKLELNNSPWVTFSPWGTEDDPDSGKPFQDIDITITNQSGADITGQADLIRVNEQFSTRVQVVNLQFLNEGDIDLTGHGLYTASSLFYFKEFDFKNSINGEISITNTVPLLDVSTGKGFSFANEGKINVTGKDWYKDVIHTRISSGKVTFSNTGTISLNGYAKSILRIESNLGNDIHAELSNTGNIKTNNNYVSHVNITDGVFAHINTYKIPARSGIFYAPRGFVGSGKFVVDGSTHLIFSPKPTQETLLNVYGTQYDGIFNGSKDLLQGKLTSEMFSTTDQAWKVDFIENDPNDWTKSQVRIHYEATEDAGQQINVYSNRLNRDRGFRFATLIDPLKVEQNFNVFVRPYVSRSDYRLTDRSSVDTEGFLLGFTAKVNNEFEHGVHFGYEKSEFESGANTQKADSEAFSLGYHSLWNFVSNAYIKFIATGSYTDNDLTYTTLDDYAKDNFNGWSFFGDLRLGYKFLTQSYGTFSPEVAFVYTYNDTDAFDLKFKNENGINRHFESSDNSDFFIQPMLTWEHNIANSKGIVFKPKISLGARALIGDTGIDAVSEFGGNRYVSSIDDERWQGVAMAKVGVYTDPIEIDLAYTGAYGQSSTSHIGWITFGYHW